MTALALRTMLASASVVALCGISACGDVAPLPPIGQVVLWIDSDAPVPRGPGEASRTPADPAPLFDRLRVELFAPGESEPCLGCTRDFAIEERALRERRASFGFVPKPNTQGYRARLRLYRTGGVAGPRAASTIEHVVAIPPVPAEGVVELYDVLRVDEVSQPSGGTLDSPLDLHPGRPTTSLVGSWEGAKRTPCDTVGGKHDQQACVPGGAFWAGNLRSESREALVVLSPFYVDATEVTVGAFRASRLAKLDDPAISAPRTCTFTEARGGNEALSVNCVSKAAAEAFCKANGKELPTSAELEYLQGGLRGDPYVWGVDPPQCADAVFARNAGSDPDAAYFELTSAGRACNRLGIGPARAGEGARDRLVFEGGDVLDLTGNLTEWVRDEGDDAPCFAGGVQRNPLCVEAGTTTLHLKGGAWGDAVSGLRASARRGTSRSAGGSNSAGFRCAKH